MDILKIDFHYEQNIFLLFIWVFSKEKKTDSEFHAPQNSEKSVQNYVLFDCSKLIISPIILNISEVKFLPHVYLYAYT